MIYLIEGNDRYLVQQQLQTIWNKHKIKKESIEYFDAKTPLSTVIQSTMSYGFFSDTKVVVYENPKLLSGGESLQLLNEYVDENDETTILVLTSDKLDARLKNVTELKKKAIYLKVESLSIKTKLKYIKDQLKQHNMTLDSHLLTQFEQKMPLNASIIQLEIEKLKLLDEPITTDVLDNLITTYFEDTTFEFVDIILNKSLSESLNYYNRIKDIPVLQIIGALAAKLRLIYQVSILNEHYSEQEIINITKSKPYPVKLAYQQIYKRESNYFLSLLNELSQLSYQIRHGLIQENLGFELFLMNKERL